MNKKSLENKVKIHEDWIKGFIMGQYIYETSKGDKEMLISIPKKSNILKTLKNIFDEDSYEKGGRNIIKLRNKKIDKIINKWLPTNNNDNFIIGLIESNFDIFVEREQKDGKVIKTRQYIKVPNHIIVKNFLISKKIKYKESNNKSIKITKRSDCARFFKHLKIEWFMIYRDEIVEKSPHIS